MCGYEAIPYILLAHYRYTRFVGEPGAYRAASFTPEMIKQLCTPLIALLSPLLFFAPNAHCTALYQVYTSSIGKAEWNTFIQKLSTEWKEFVVNVRINVMDCS